MVTSKNNLIEEIDSLRQKNRYLSEGLELKEYQCSFGEPGLSQGGFRIKAFNAYAAIAQICQKYPNCQFYEAVLEDPYRNTSGGYFCWSLDLPAEWVRFENSEWKSHSPQQEQIKAVRASIRLWAESLNSPLPDYVWVLAYYLAASYLEQTHVLQQIRPENRQKFNEFVEMLRPLVPQRQPAKSYVFFPGFGKDPQSDVEPIMQEFVNLLQSWGLRLTEDSFQVLQYSIDVDETLVEVLDTMRNLHENLKFLSSSNAD